LCAAWHGPHIHLFTPTSWRNTSRSRLHRSAPDVSVHASGTSLNALPKTQMRVSSWAHVSLALQACNNIDTIEYRSSHTCVQCPRPPHPYGNIHFTEHRSARFEHTQRAKRRALTMLVLLFGSERSRLSFPPSSWHKDRNPHVAHGESYTMRGVHQLGGSAPAAMALPRTKKQAER